MPKKIKKIVSGLLISGLVTIIVASLATLNLFELSNQKLSHSLYHERELSNEIVIVAIDDLSLLPKEEGGLDAAGHWTNEYFAQTLDEINLGEPAVVMIDVLFANTSSTIPQEDVLKLVSENLRTEDFIMRILSYLQVPNPIDLSFVESMEAVENLFLIKYTTGAMSFDGESFHFTESREPISIFSDVAEMGFIDRQAGDNRTIYRVPYQLTVDGITEKHMDLKIVERYLNEEITGLPVEEGYWLINYAQKTNGFPMYSFVDVYNGKVDPTVFEDKIVLIGATSAISQDLFFTPIDSEKIMSGIEVSANAIQTLLDKSYLAHQSFGPLMLLILGLTLISVFAFLYLPVWGGLVVLVVEIAAFPFYAQWRFDKGVIINLIWPVFAVVTAYLLVMAYRNVTEFREKRKLKNAFAHYVSPDLVNQISASGADLALGGERRVMTTLFLDIENFTNLSEKLEAQEVVKVINTYFDAFAKEIMAHGGTVDKFEGDAIMALFGAPLKSEDHALKACQTAMAIRSRVADLNQQSGHDLNVRIGIATGECIVGNMGSEARFDYTAMGDTVNTASRLEGGNKFYGTRVLVNAKTMEGAQSAIFFRRIDRVRLKGKEEAIDIYEVMGANEAVSEEGKLLVNEWHTALDHYRNQDWDVVEEKIRSILEKMPGDGPATTYLKRIEALKISPPQQWDGTWRFSSK